MGAGAASLLALVGKWPLGLGVQCGGAHWGLESQAVSMGPVGSVGLSSRRTRGPASVWGRRGRRVWGLCLS